MNKTFKTIFNQITGTWVAVSEMAKSAGKKASATCVLPSKVNNNSYLVAHGSGSLKKAFAPLCLALMGVLGSTNLFASQAYCYIDDTSQAFYCTGGIATQNSSVSLGYQSKALGEYSISMGYYNTAEGANSVSIGRASHAYGKGSSTLGYGNNASSDYSSALGYSNTASGQYSSAVGVWNEANGDWSSAVGSSNIASGQLSSAFGAYSTAAVDFGTAIGFGSLANRGAGEKGLFAPANFDELNAKGKAAWQATSAALAVGNPANTKLDYYDSVTNAWVTINTPITRQITGVAAGSEDTDAVNVAQLKAAQTCSYDTKGNLSCGKNSAITADIENATVVGSENTVSAQYYSSAVGYKNTASGSFSSAVGFRNTASGEDSSALGHMNTASGQNFSSAIGAFNTASGNRSSAVGFSNSASGENSHAYGGQNNYSGNNSTVTVGTGSVAFGFQNNYKDEGEVAVGEKSSALGVGNAASGQSSSAVGFENIADGIRSSALGNYNRVAGKYSSAVGFENIAYGAGSSAFGRSNFARGESSSAMGVYNIAKGQDSSAFGYLNQALSDNSHAFGGWNNLSMDSTVTMGKGAVALGYQNNYKETGAVTVGQESTAVGVKNATSGRYSSAVGYSNIATGQYSTAMGYANKAQGTNSFVLGRGNVATGFDSSAVGLFNTANGDKSSVFGFNNQATGANSLVMGRGNQVSSLNSTAMGVNNIVSGNYSSTFGFDNKAQGANSFALGRSSTAVANFSTALGYGAFANRVAGDVGYSPNNVNHNADKTGVWKSTSGVLSVGDPNNENNKGIITRQITGVAAGKNDTDAVNVAQLKVLKQDIDNLSNQLLSTKSATLLALNEVQNDETSLEVKPTVMLMSATLRTEPEPQLKEEVSQDETAPNVKMTTLRSATLSATPEPAATTEISTTTEPVASWSITVAGEKGDFPVSSGGVAKFVGDGQNITTDATGGEVKISLADDISVNSVNAGGTVVNQNGVTLPSGVALTNSGLNNGGQVISNVAPGVKPTDAVNVSQLNNAMGGVYGRIDSVEKHANAGTAQSLAAANMPTASQPGEGMLAISGGVYRGEQGYAIGYSQLSENGRWVIRATGSGNSRNHFGGAVGVGFKLF